MADKAVERVEPPYPDHWDSQVKGDDTAYVMVYTHVDDSIESVAFNKTGGEIKRMAGDFRRPATTGTTQAVGRTQAPRPSDRPGGPMFPGDYVSPDAGDKPAKPTRPAAEVIPGVPPITHASAAVHDELPLASRPLPDPKPAVKPPVPKP